MQWNSNSVESGKRLSSHVKVLLQLCSSLWQNFSLEGSEGEGGRQMRPQGGDEGGRECGRTLLQVVTFPLIFLCVR